MDHESIVKSYRRYARTYDRVFGKVFAHGRRVCIARMDCQPGDRVLEVGVGSGISLPAYPAGSEVVGIDISPDMLSQAERRAREEAACDAEVKLMDCEAMEFPENSFDKVVAMYVASVVPNPQAMVQEIKRVCRPGGDILIVNHFRNRHWVLGTFEKAISPLSKLLGFRPDFSLEEFLEQNPLDVQRITPVNAFGYWSLIEARNDKPEPATQPSAATG